MMHPGKHLAMMVCLLVIGTGAGVAKGQSAPEGAAEQSWGVREIVDRVLRFDPRLRVKSAEKLIAHVEQRRARWNRVQGQARIQVGHQLTSTGWLPTEQMERRTQDHMTAAAVAELRLPLYAGGRISADLDAAQARVRAARHDEEALRHQLVLSALVAFAEVLAAQEQEIVSYRARERAQDLADMTRKRRLAGIATDADVARVELNFVRYDEDLALQRGASRTAKAVLQSLLLIDDRLPVKWTGSLSELGKMGRPPVASHPEVQRAQSALDEARARQRSAEAGHLPSVDLFALGQYGNTVLGDSGMPLHQERFGPMSGSAAVGVQAGWTVFDFFVTRDRVAVAQAEVAARRAGYDVTLFSLQYRRNEAVLREQAATERLRALDQGRHIAIRALDLARAQYETGNGTLTEVLSADLEAIRLESNRVQASLQLVLAHVDRMQAEGSQP